MTEEKYRAIQLLQDMENTFTEPYYGNGCKLCDSNRGVYITAKQAIDVIRKQYMRLLRGDNSTYHKVTTGFLREQIQDQHHSILRLCYDLNELSNKNKQLEAELKELKGGDSD